MERGEFEGDAARGGLARGDADRGGGGLAGGMGVEVVEDGGEGSGGSSEI
jgi:hypothetical protein